MKDAVVTLGPLFLFMLIPLWIPITAVVVGSLLDRVSPREENVHAARLAERRARAAQTGTAPCAA